VLESLSDKNLKIQPPREKKSTGCGIMKNRDKDFIIMGILLQFLNWHRFPLSKKAFQK